MAAFLIHKSLFTPKPPTIHDTNAGTQITIYRDFDSHFRINGSINGIAVTFLIDTGATSVAIPGSIAKACGLPQNATVQSETANGTATGYLTKINSLIIGPLELTNVGATIIPTMNSDQVLLGMNVLSKFTIQHTKSELTITVPATPEKTTNWQPN